MKDIPRPLLRFGLRLFLLANTSESLRLRFARVCEDMLDLAEGLPPEGRRRRRRVSEMPGVAEDMRDWSSLMLLSHMALANTALARVVETLGKGQPFVETVDYKNDFTPSPDTDEEALTAFRRAMDLYVSVCAALPELPSSRTRPVLEHPVFGLHGVKGWQGVAVVHALAHLAQLKALDKAVRGG